MRDSGGDVLTAPVAVAHAHIEVLVETLKSTLDTTTVSFGGSDNSNTWSRGLRY